MHEVDNFVKHEQRKLHGVAGVCASKGADDKFEIWPEKSVYNTPTKMIMGSGMKATISRSVDAGSLRKSRQERLANNV